MIQFHGRGILLDIEGTTSAVEYIYGTMFPYARERLAAYLEEHWNEIETQRAVEQLARDVRMPADSNQPGIITEALKLMDADAKVTGLKQLQGLIWRTGFIDGALRGHIFPDVPTALRRWNAKGIGVCIYSSGSIEAQKLYFGHSDAGDLTPYIGGYFDTTTGPKREALSYSKIVQEMKRSPEEVLFLSDVVAELDAARTVGLKTGLTVRPGNEKQPTGHLHPSVLTFDDIEAD